MHLFCLTHEKLNPISVYQNLTQNDRLPLTKIRINQMLLNLYDEDGENMDVMLKEKPQYSFDDIINLDLNTRTYLIGKPIGQRFVFANEYPFISDPFLVNEYDKILESSRNDVSTLNSTLILETGNIFKNTIFLCLAQDVFEYAEQIKISTKYASKIYFPFLYKQHIESIETLVKQREILVEETNELITPALEQSFKNINMFHRIFQNNKDSYIFSKNNRETGIKSFKLSIYPDFNVKIPIDVIFKLIHATEEFPLIKYNPETRQEKVYRLFAPSITEDGRKIPYLPKTSVFKLTRLIGKNKSVSVYTKIQYNGNEFFMICEFKETGVITIYPLNDFDVPILLTNGDNALEHVDEIVKLSVNPLIEQIKPFFAQSGLDIPLFSSVQLTNIEITEIKYKFIYNIKKPINLDEFNGCLTSIFTIENDDFKNEVKMRYKRVSNYNKRDSQEAFIIEKIDQGYKFNEIIEQLTQQFDDLNQEMAEDLIAKIRNELEFTRGINKKRALMLKINPGFQTIMLSLIHI